MALLVITSRYSGQRGGTVPGSEEVQLQVCLMARTSQRPAGTMQLARLWALLLLLPLGALIGQVQATVWRSQQWRHNLQPNAQFRQLAQAVDAGSRQSNPSNGAGASPSEPSPSSPVRPIVNISVPGAGSSSGSSGGSSGAAPTLAVNLSLSFTVPPSAIPITLGRVPAPPALNTSAGVDAGGDQLLPQLQSLNGQLLPSSGGGTVQLEIVWTVQFQARVPIQPPPTPILFVPESPMIAATVCEESDLRSLIYLFSTALSDAAYGPSDGGGNATDGGGNGGSNVTDGGGAGVISSPGDASVSPGDAGSVGSASNNTDGGDSISVSSSGSGGNDGAMSSWAAASQSTAACVLDGEPRGSSTAGNSSNSSNSSGSSSNSGNSSDSSNSSNSGNGSAQGSPPPADRGTGTVTGSGSASPSTDTRAQASTSPTLLPVPSASPTTSRDATGGRRQQRRLAQFGGGFGFGGGILQPRPLLPPSSPSPPTAPPRPPAPPAPPPQPPYIPWFPPAPPSPPDSGACDSTPRRLRLSVQAPGDADLSALVTAGVQALRDFRAGPRETDVCELDTEKDIVITAQVQARFLLAVAPSATAGSGPSLCSSVASQAPGALQGVLGVPLTLDRQEACVLATGSSGSGGNANGGATMVPAPGADPSPRQETQPVNAPASPSGSPTNVVGVVVGTVVAVMAVGLMVGLGYAYKRRRVDGGGAVAGGVEDGKGLDGGGVVAPDDVVFHAGGGGDDGGRHWQQQQHLAAHVGGSGGSGSGSAAVSGTGGGGGVGAMVAVAGSGLAPHALYPPPGASPLWAGGVGGGSAPAAAGYAPMQAVGMGMYGTYPAASLGVTSMPGAGLHGSGGQVSQPWGAHHTASAAPAPAAAAPAAAAAHDPAARDAEARRLNQKFKEMQMAQFMASIATSSEAAPSGTGAAAGSGGGVGRGKAGGKGGAAAAGAQGAQGPAGVQRKKLTKKQAKAAAAAAAAASEEPLMQGTVPAADGAPAGQNSLVSYIISLIKQSGGKNAEATAAAAAAAAAAVTSSQAAVQAPAALAVAGPGAGGADAARNASAPAPAAVAAATPATAAAAVTGFRGLAAAPAASPRGPPTTAAAAVAAPAAAAAATKLPVSQQPAPVAARRPFRAGEDLGAAAAAAAAAALSVLTGRPAATKAGAAQAAGNAAPASHLPQGSDGQASSLQLGVLLGTAAAGAPGAGLVRGNSTNSSATGRAAAVHAPAVPAPAAASDTGTALEARGTARISNDAFGGAHSLLLSAVMCEPAATTAARSGFGAAGLALPFAAATRAEDPALLSSAAALRARAVTTDSPSEQAEANPNFIKVRTPAGRVAQIQIAPLQGTAASGVAGVAGVAGAAAPGVARSGSIPAPLRTHRSGSAHPASLIAAGLGTTGFGVGIGGMGAPMGGFGTTPLGSSSPPLPSQHQLASPPVSQSLAAQAGPAGLGVTLNPALVALPSALDVPGAALTDLAPGREPGGLHGGGSASSKLCLDLGGPGGEPGPRLTSGAREAAGLGGALSARAAAGVERAAGLGRSFGASGARTASDFEGVASLAGRPGLAGSLTSGGGVSAAGGLAPSEGSGPLGRFHTYVGTGGMGAPSSQPLNPASLSHALSDPSHQYHGRPSGTTWAGAGAWTVSGASLGASEAVGAGFAPVASAGGAWGGGRGAGSGLLHPQHVAQEDVALELAGQMGPGQRLGQGQGKGRGLAQESVDAYGGADGPGVWAGQRDRPGKQGGGAWGTGAGHGVAGMLDEAAARAAAAAAAGNTVRLGNGGSGGGGSGAASRSDLSGDRSAPASDGAGSSLGHSRNSHRSQPSPLDAFTAHHVAALARAPMAEDRAHAAGGRAGMPVGAGVYPDAGAYTGAGIFPPGATGIYHQEPGIYPGARGHQGVGGYQESGAQQLASSEQSGGSNSWGAAAVRPAPLGAPRPVHSTASDQAGQGSTARRDSDEVAGGSGTGPLVGAVLVSGSAGGPDGTGSHGDGDAGGDIVDGGGDITASMAGCGGSPHSSEGHTSRAAAHHALLAGDGQWGAFGRPQQLATPLSSRAGGPEAPQTQHHWQQQQQQVQQPGGLPPQQQHQPQDWQHGPDVAAMFADSQDLYMDAAVFNADNPEPDLFQLLSDLASPPSSPSHAQGSVESPALAVAGMGTGGSAGSVSPEVTLPVMAMGGSEALMQGQAGIQQGVQGGPPGAGPKVWGPERQRQAAKAAAYSMSRLLVQQQQAQQQVQQGSWVGPTHHAAVQLGLGGDVRDVGRSMGEKDGWQGEVRGQAADDLVQLFEEWAAGCSQVPTQVEAQV